MAVIAGNWKMHMGPEECGPFFAGLDVSRIAAGTDLLVFPPVVSLHAVSNDPHRDPRVRLGVQNIHWEDAGAYTGETSAGMAAAAGAAFALVGHSERRHVFGESDEETSKKVSAAHRHGLTPVLCVGETLEERRGGRVDEVILRQLDTALDALREGARFLVAYEPVWAIGTGETATPADASQAHGTLRRRLREALGEADAAAVPLLYGGSVKPGNAGDLLGSADVDGVLVGGASLDPDSFLAIAIAADGAVEGAAG